MNQIIRTLITLVFFTCGLQSALAQSADKTAPGMEPGAALLDTITVMGTRTEKTVLDNPVTVSVVKREDIERQPAESVAELIRDIPGVQVIDTSAPGMKRIRIRGESSRRVTILVDGQEITDHSTSGAPMLVDPANIERIEVLRGPASVLYGAKAIGGVINIITRKGAPVPIQLEAGGGWYSGTRGWQGRTAVSGTVDAFDYRFSASANRHHDREVPKGRWSDSGRLDDSAYHNGELAAHLGYRLGKQGNHYLAFKADKHWLDTDAWTDPFSFEYPVVDFGVDLPQRDLGKAGLYYDATDLGPMVRKLHLDSYYQAVDRLFTNHVNMKPVPSMAVDVESASVDRIINYGGTAQLDLELQPDHYTIVGLYYLMDDLDTDKTTNTSTRIGPRPPTVLHELRSDRASAETLSAFVQDEWFLPHDLMLAAGVRYNHISANLDASDRPIDPEQQHRTTSNLVKSLGLTWTGLRHTTFRALYAEGYIMPTLLEMFTDNSAGRGTLTYGNPDLTPETSRNLEVGLRTQRNGLVLDLTIYDTRARDYITTRPCSVVSVCPNPALPDAQIYVNADTAHTYGLEFLAEYSIPDTAFVPYFSGALARRSLRYVPRAGADPNPNQPVTGRDASLPTLTGRLGLRYETGMRRHGLWADIFLRGSTHSAQSDVDEGQHLLIEETRPLPGWTTLNIATGATFGKKDQYALNLHLNNLFNTSYRASVDELPATGRNIAVTFQLQL